MIIKNKDKTLMLLGVVHSAQANDLLKLHIKVLKERGFSKKFIDEDTKRILALRELMLSRVKSFKPEVIAEECGPWLIRPGDRLNKIIGGKKTVLQRLYKDGHAFVDAKINKFGKKPSHKVREKAIANQVIREFKKNRGIKRIAIIVGAHHFQNIKNILESHNLQLKAEDLKKKFKFPS